jgi:hypothetical protein
MLSELLAQALSCPTLPFPALLKSQRSELPFSWRKLANAGARVFGRTFAIYVDCESALLSTEIGRWFLPHVASLAPGQHFRRYPGKSPNLQRRAFHLATWSKASRDNDFVKIESLVAVCAVPSSMSSHDNAIAEPQQSLVRDIIEQFRIGPEDVRRITKNFVRQMSRLVSIEVYPEQMLTCCRRWFTALKAMAITIVRV